MATRIAIAGAAGRMGRRLVALCAVDDAVECVAAVEDASSPHRGQDAGVLAGIGPYQLKIASTLDADFDVLIDFTTAAATGHWLAACRQRRRAIVIGTTGHSPDQLGAIEAASKDIAVLKSPNMSVGVNVALRVVEQLAKSLDASYDVEITEAHHRFKVDAPSGTALAFRDAVVRGRGSSPQVVHGRQGVTGARPAGEIGMHSLRIGDTVGEHVVAFGGLGETISISHSAHSRDTFASGAIRAAKWLAGKPAGLFSMDDVLFGRA